MVGIRNLLVVLLVLGLVHPLVVVNSQDPVDVSSAVFYANIKGEQLLVLTPDLNTFTFARMSGRGGNIFLIESPTAPMFTGVKSDLEANGNSVELLSSTGPDLNIELARRSGASKFIVSDPAYGYNIVSTIPYAKVTESYLIFANVSNVEQVRSFFNSNRPSSVMQYGTVDAEVSTMIGELGVSTEKIDNGDKYYDNIELLDKYFSIVPSKRDVIFADGSFLEVSITNGDSPVILVSDVMPDRLYSYILQKVRGNQIAAGTLIGSDYVDSVYNLMKNINNELGEKKLSVFVKFGQGTAQGGTPSALSVFFLPYPYADVSLDSASYNPSSGAFELIYSNKGNAPAYVKSNIVVLKDGQQIGAIGDDEQYMIGRGESKGRRYAFSNPGEGQLSINDTTFYGVSKYTTDRGFMKYMDVGRISFVDQSGLLLADASYSPLEDKLSVKVRNNAETDAFYTLTVAYVNSEGLTKYTEEQIRNISAGTNEIITLSGVVQLPMDKADGTIMNVTAAYGAREAFMEKEASAPVKVEGFPWWILLILLLIILIIAYWYYRKKKKEKEAVQEEAVAPKKKQGGKK